MFDSKMPSVFGLVSMKHAVFSESVFSRLARSTVPSDVDGISMILYPARETLAGFVP